MAQYNGIDTAEQRHRIRSKRIFENGKRGQKMSIKHIDLNNIQFEKDGNGNILVAFYDGKGTSRYKQLKSEYLNLYFEFYGTKYYLTNKHIKELNKKYNWSVV